ncbi:hypothetical protein [Mammaliicoccus vitulinus]|uniref:hypothetical protein n=1 Tax=Mammaliicoccus vitulinus TaxID=71237 RepID=UPI00248BC819|nr:hypothetical protein [Mammaliicoccus vitulinus]
MELVAIKLPKTLVEGIKKYYDSEDTPNRLFLRSILLSDLPEGKAELIANELDVDIKEVNKLRSQKNELLKPNTNLKNNKRLERMLKQSEFTNQMMLSYIKLMLSDTGYAFPDNIEERLNSFDDYDKELKQHIIKKFEE